MTARIFHGAVIKIDRNALILFGVDLDTSACGEYAVVNVVLPDDANGNVTITVNGKNYVAVVKYGVASVTISDLANQAVSKINEGISKITAYADEVVQMIEEEAALIAEYLKTNINGFLAGILPDWFDDACKTGVIDTIATPEMKSALQK